MLKRQLAELSKHPVEGFSAGLEGDNIFIWEVGLYHYMGRRRRAARGHSEAAE
jgi:hypothetical protein